MSAHSTEAVHQQVKIYIRVFLTLAALTVLTVGVSYLKLPVAIGISVALFIAAVKSSLVAAFFMHLKGEKKIILSILLLAFAFFLVLLLYPSWHLQ